MIFTKHAMALAFIVGLALGWVAATNYTELNGTAKIQRKLETYVTENDSALAVYAIRHVSKSPEVWDVSYRNKEGFHLTPYVVEKDSIFEYKRSMDPQLGPFSWTK